MKNPHPDKIVVSTKNLEEFQNLCDELGIDYEVYAHPIPISVTGNCLIKLSLDDINLLLMAKSERIVQSGMGMRTYIDDKDLMMYHRIKKEQEKMYAELKLCNRYYKDHCQS